MYRENRSGNWPYDVILIQDWISHCMRERERVREKGGRFLWTWTQRRMLLLNINSGPLKHCQLAASILLSISLCINKKKERWEEKRKKEGKKGIKEGGREKVNEREKERKKEREREKERKRERVLEAIVHLHLLFSIFRNNKKLQSVWHVLCNLSLDASNKELSWILITDGNQIKNFAILQL